jgi:predicted DNA-binding transcriptional regulator YafY
VVDGVQVRLGYAARDGAKTERVVHPLGLVAKGSVWYLVAGTDAGQRTFRVNRVRSVTPTDEPVDRPPGFDLAETWKSIVATLDEQRTPVRVVAVADGDVVWLLRTLFGTRLTLGGDTGDGRIAVEIRGHEEQSVAGELAGLGARIEVLEPAAVRKRLATIGAELTRRYGRS